MRFSALVLTFAVTLFAHAAPARLTDSERAALIRIAEDKSAPGGARDKAFKTCSTRH